MEDKSLLCIFNFFRDHGDCKNTNGKFILVTLSKTIIHIHKSNMKWTLIHEPSFAHAQSLNILY